MNVELIVDSTVDVPEHIRSRLTVVPLTIHFGQEEYLDGVTLDKHRFYERLVESDVLPTTSQASPAAFDREFRRVRRSGGSAVVLTISAQLSGTYQSACIAAAEYDNIYVVDSGTAAIGAGILAEYALACLDRGMDAAGLARALEQKRQDVCVLALVDTLEYLKRGGRISKTTALAGGLLNIKPVLTIENGEILLVGKARGSRQGNNLLVEKIHACGGIDFSLPILLGYTGLTDVFLKKYVEDSRALWENGTDRLDSTLIGGVIAPTPGPGPWRWPFSARNKLPLGRPGLVPSQRACKPGCPGVKWNKKGVRRMQPGIMELDLHGKNAYQARVAIDAALRRASSGVYRLRLIHGYHGGTALRDLCREYAGHPRVLRLVASPGSTDLVLREF